MCTECAVTLEKAWDPTSGLEPLQQLEKWVEQDRLWSVHGSRLVVVVVVDSHYYVLVAVMDQQQPLMYILKSLGGRMLWSHLAPLSFKTSSSGCNRGQVWVVPTSRLWY